MSIVYFHCICYLFKIQVEEILVPIVVYKIAQSNKNGIVFFNCSGAYPADGFVRREQQ